MVDALRLVVGTVEQVVVLGAGGTARAALAAARDLGAGSVTVYARRPEALAELAVVAEALGVRLIGADWASIGESGGGGADVVVSTVPKGVADGLAESIRWRRGSVLFDALYEPWPTPLAAAAAAAGCRVVPGLNLLLAQAVRQFELFTGVTAPVDAMRSTLTAAREP
jgi:shikimate dehydrogenase